MAATMISLPHVPNASCHAHLVSTAKHYKLISFATFSNNATTSLASPNRKMEHSAAAAAADIRSKLLQVLCCRRTAEEPNRKMEHSAAAAAEIRSELLQVLRSRRTAEVPLSVEPAQPLSDPLYQETPKPTFSEAMESCPKKKIPNLSELLQEENFYLTTEAGEQGRLPVLLLKLKESVPGRRPAVVFLHSTHKNKEWLRPLLEAYASRNYIAVAIDSRYHGERASNLKTYQDALVSSWKKGDTMPFIFDTVWDLIKLADHLTEREDVDPSRIGITGESLGGMHAWFGAAADTRYSVVVPIIGVQGFRWAIEHDKWHARVDSLKRVFEEARTDLGKSEIDKEVVEKVWDRIAPGLASSFDSPSPSFDSPYTVPAIAPRPLLILNGEKDPRCPLAGLELLVSSVSEIYEKANSADDFKLVAEAGIGHQMTPLMVKQASEWFDQHFKPSTCMKIRKFLKICKTALLRGLKTAICCCCDK